MSTDSPRRLSDVRGRKNALRLNKSFNYLEDYTEHIAAPWYVTVLQNTVIYHIAIILIRKMEI